MRRHFRRKEIRLYRLLFGIVCVLCIGMLCKGILLLASDHVSEAAKNTGKKILQSLYVNAATTENAYLRYVVAGEGKADTIISSFVERIPLNFYATHNAETMLVIEAKEDGNIIEENQLFYQYTKDETKEEEESSNMMTEQEQQEDQKINDQLSALANLAAKENEHILIENESTHEGLLTIQYTTGDIEALPSWNATNEMIENVKSKVNTDSNVLSVRSLIQSAYNIQNMRNLSYLISNYYIEDPSTKATAKLFDIDKLLSKDMTISQSNEEPQILIYHTHASETFADSKEGAIEDTVVGAGEYLTELLTKYGYQVYHDTTAYDQIRGRDYSYSTARPYIEQFLAEHKSIEVIIDLHRDSGAKRVTTINGKETAQIMLFNGLCRDATGPIESLDNPNIEENLAFSLQTNLVGNTYYPGLMKRIYLKKYRYNMHFTEKYLLVELGTDKNTVKEAYNAMEPFAFILDQVLTNP